jgi:hypothetical protein
MVKPAAAAAVEAINDLRETLFPLLVSMADKILVDEFRG